MELATTATCLDIKRNVITATKTSKDNITMVFKDTHVIISDENGDITNIIYNPIVTFLKGKEETNAEDTDE